MIYHVQFPGLGLDLTVNRVALSIGGFNIYWYGVIIAAGMLLAMLYAFRNAVDYGIDSDRLVDVVAIGTVMAIVCARIYYVAMAPFAYQSIWEMIDIRKGGIAIYGAVLGAFIFGGLAAKWRKVPLLPLFDLVSLGFLIGQGIGRWGNFVNQEAFGTNTTLPWGMYSEGTEAYLRSVQVTLPSGMTVDPTAPVHPTFLYESIWCLVGFLALAAFFKKRRFNGQIFLGYVIWYGLGRAWIEGLRTDSLLIGSTGLRASQLVAIGSVLAAAVLMVIGLRQGKNADRHAGCEGHQKAGRGRGAVHPGHPACQCAPRRIRQGHRCHERASRCAGFEHRGDRRNRGPAGITGNRLQHGDRCCWCKS